MTGKQLTVDLFVRSLSPTGARAGPSAAIERLEALAETETVDDFSVHIWGKEVDLSSGTAGEAREVPVLERVAAFRSWAAERGFALDAFERRTVSTLTGETYTALRLPVVVLAESVGGELDWVTPCTTESGVLTVEERLGSLEEHGEGRRPRDDRTVSREEPRGRTLHQDTAPQ